MKKTGKYVITEEYKRFISGVNIKNIYLKSSTVNCNQEYIDFKKVPNISIDNESSYEIIEENLFKVLTKFVLKVRYENIDKAIIDIRVTFVIIYKNKIPITKEFFNIFKSRNVPLNIWPYFREYIHNTCNRIGVPPLVLPVVQV